MKNYNFLSIILLGITLASCNETKKGENTLFTFDNSKFKEQYNPQESLSFEILNSNSKTIDSVVYYVNDKKIGSKKGVEKLSFELKEQKLGYQNLKALVFYEGQSSVATTRVELVSNIQPKLLKYTIVNTYPHDKTSFTQGLEFYKDTLYESTGQNGTSYVRKYGYKTGKIFKQTDLDKAYFGEGISILNDQIFQLTWTEKTGFIYNANTLKLEKTFTYDKDIQGWGLTNDGKYLYQSDGTEKIWKMDPKTLKVVDNINVYTTSTKIKSINELEWIDGLIYGNIWQKDAIAIINPINGAAEAVLNLSNLRKLVKATEDDFLNGIAYNPKTKTIFVTGKNWDKMFEIKVSE